MIIIIMMINEMIIINDDNIEIKWMIIIDNDY